MAVPAQDQRDWEFAAAHGLPVVRTVQPPEGFEGEAYLGDGPAINSGFLDGLNVEEAKARMIDWLEAQGKGRRRVNYKLRDWLFSRQRYWGEPFPIIFVNSDAKAVPDDALPVRLPELEEFKPSGSPEGPLAAATEWIETVDPETGRPARRETNTMPQWAGSCWYYLRYIDPHNSERLVDPEKERYWMPVDLYVGGAEHAVLHLLYARFWHKVLYRAGVVSTPEPFVKLVHQGMILGELEYTGYFDAEGRPVSADRVGNDGRHGDAKGAGDDKGGAGGGDATAAGAGAGSITARRLDESEVVKEGERFVLRDAPSIAVDARAHKMSKSRGNVVNPDQIVARHGADAFRLYEMFMGPLEQVKPWASTGVEGTHRFLNRVWRLFVDEAGAGADGEGLGQNVTRGEPTSEQQRLLHRTIAKVTADIEGLRFNTAIAALMELTNAAYKWEKLPFAIAEPFVLLLAPLAPHLAEELWERLGHTRSLAYEPWPEADPEFLRADTLEIPVQVDGKVRAKISVPAEADQASVIRLAHEDANVQRHLEGREIKRAVYVPGRILNFVLGGK
jgi:leucyl-tRNA synthetase